MNITITVDRDDLLLWATKRQYKPSSPDLTKIEMATEFIAGEVKGNIDRARDRITRQAVVKSDVTVVANAV